MNADAGTGNTLRVLLLEDARQDAELCEHELKAAGLPISIRRVDNRRDFEDALQHDPPRLILSDFSMPRFDGMHALEIARANAPQTPFIFLSGTIGEERAVEAMRNGATDYVLKDHLERLVPVVTRALAEQRSREEFQAQRAALDETRELFEGVLRSLSDVVWSLALCPLRILYVNDAAEAMFGRPASDLVANPQLCFDIVHPADRANLMTLWEHATCGVPFETEHRIVTTGGETRYVHVRAKPVTDAAATVLRIDGIVSDITQRRIHEDRITRLLRMRKVLSGLDAALLRVRSRQELFADACHIAVRDGGFKLAWLGEVVPESRAVYPRARSGEHPECLEAALTRVPTRDGPAALVDAAVQTGQLACCNDLETRYPAYRDSECLRRGFRSAAVVPLRTGQRVDAVLVLCAEEVNFFDEEERRLLEELSGNVSFGLDYMDKAKQLDYLAYYDALTGLPNRELFFDRLAQLITGSVTSHSVALVVLDVARFRSINETIGRAMGDAVLTQIAARLRDRANTCARVAGDRFALTLPDAPGTPNSALMTVEHILNDLDAPIDVDGREVRVRVRAGVAICPIDAENGNALFTNAEAALRAAKANGERVRFYAREMNARAAELLALEHELRAALRLGQFVLHYQPRVLLVSGAVCGFEALLRWNSPTRGLVPPSDFVPLLEETGLILEVGRWALRRAAADAETWRAQGLMVPPIAVNVSAVQLRQSDFVDDVREAISSAGQERAVEIELTESMLMTNVEANASKLAEIRAAGIKIAIDDFGTGYSSLAYLARLPVDALKIDRSFVAAMEHGAVQRAIVTTVISLARNLGLCSVGEGVETRSQADLLCELGCEEAQGNLFGRPLPADHVASLLTATEAGVAVGAIEQENGIRAA